MAVRVKSWPGFAEAKSLSHYRRTHGGTKWARQSRTAVPDFFIKTVFSFVSGEVKFECSADDVSGFYLLSPIVYHITL